MNYHKLKQNNFNKNHELNGITHFFNFPFFSYFPPFVYCIAIPYS